MNRSTFIPLRQKNLWVGPAMSRRADRARTATGRSRERAPTVRCKERARARSSAIARRSRAIGVSASTLTTHPCRRTSAGCSRLRSTTRRRAGGHPPATRGAATRPGRRRCSTSPRARSARRRSAPPELRKPERFRPRVARRHRPRRRPGPRRRCGPSGSRGAKGGPLPGARVPEGRRLEAPGRGGEGHPPVGRALRRTGGWRTTQCRERLRPRLLRSRPAARPGRLGASAFPFPFPCSPARAGDPCGSRATRSTRCASRGSSRTAGGPIGRCVVDTGRW